MKPYNILLDKEIVEFIIDQHYLLNKNTNKKEEVLWSLAGQIAIGDHWYSGENLLKNFTFLDGSPCGF